MITNSQNETEGRAYAINPELVETVQLAAETGNHGKLAELLVPLHEADIADLLEQIGDESRREIVSIWGQDFDSDVLSELDAPIQEEVISFLAPAQLAETVRELESDKVVDLVEDLEPRQQEIILDALDDADRVAVESSLQYPSASAGRLMQRELVLAPQHWNVGEAIDFMRAETDLPEQFYHVILVNPQAKPVGQVALGRLMGSRREIKLADIMEDDFRTISVFQGQHDVAYAFNQYHMISSPVVDESGRVVGVITIDDAMTVLDEEAEEDILLLAGVGGESLSDRVTSTTRQRFPWLVVNLATAVLASIVIAQFSEAIERIVALAVLMPIVASMGGNAGTQSLTVAVRSLATKDLTDSNAWRVIHREGMVGIMNGLIFAVIIGGIGLLWYGMPELGLVLAAAMIINMLFAGLSGILIPIGLQKAKVDPALASGVFVTTVTDVVGFLAFLGLGTAFLL